MLLSTISKPVQRDKFKVTTQSVAYLAALVSVSEEVGGVKVCLPSPPPVCSGAEQVPREALCARVGEQHGHAAGRGLRCGQPPAHAEPLRQQQPSVGGPAPSPGGGARLPAVAKPPR